MDFTLQVLHNKTPHGTVIVSSWGKVRDRPNVSIVSTVNSKKQKTSFQTAWAQRRYSYSSCISVVSILKDYLSDPVGLHYFSGKELQNEAFSSGYVLSYTIVAMSNLRILVLKTCENISLKHNRKYELKGNVWTHSPATTIVQENNFDVDWNTATGA